MKEVIKVLDCTFRDGGYYNNWFFKPTVVLEYLNAIEKSGIDIIEIGLRSTTFNKFLGPFAYCTEDFLKTIPLPQGVRTGVMINAKEYIDDVHLIDEYFTNASESPISLVRIATHFKEVPKTVQIVEKLKEKGYMIALNLMQSSGKTEEEFKKAISYINPNQVEVLYFADSFGNMKSKDIEKTLNFLKTYWSKEIGIHSHDNMGKALSNTLLAKELSVTWLDSTILGMGRGAGNTKTEYLLIELVNTGLSQYNPEALYRLVRTSFLELKNQYLWGENLMYYLSAVYNIHPTFVQEMLVKENKGDEYLHLSALKILGKKQATSFDKKIYHNVIKKDIDCDTIGEWNPESVFQGKEVLLIGGGPSVQTHHAGIKQYILKNKPIVICLNFHERINAELISYVAASHPVRLLMDYENYQGKKIPLIIPFSQAPKEINLNYDNLSIKNFGLNVQGKKN